VATQVDSSNNKRNNENFIYLKKWDKTPVSIIFELNTGDI